MSENTNNNPEPTENAETASPSVVVEETPVAQAATYPVAEQPAVEKKDDKSTVALIGVLLFAVGLLFGLLAGGLTGLRIAQHNYTTEAVVEKLFEGNRQGNDHHMQGEQWGRQGEYGEGHMMEEHHNMPGMPGTQGPQGMRGEEGYHMGPGPRMETPPGPPTSPDGVQKEDGGTFSN